MATVRFDLSINVAGAKGVEGLDSDSKEDLFKKPDLKYSKEKQAGSTVRQVAEESEVSTTLELEEISEAYSELIEKSEALLNTVAERSKGLDFVFDPNENPELAEAVNSIFKGANNKITYKMYLAALKLDKDISIEIGESESGFVRQFS